MATSVGLSIVAAASGCKDACGNRDQPEMILDDYCDSYLFSGSVAVARGPGQVVGDACLPQFDYPRPWWWHDCFSLESDKMIFDKHVCGPNLAAVRVELGSVKLKKRTHVTCCAVYDGGTVLDATPSVDGQPGSVCAFSTKLNRPLTAFEQHERAQCVFDADASPDGL